ncbi:GNAT family N-acetyltransferase [Cognaticolwellia mytili]|uniref:GNAT family N-acetyltransferase n=1 Tax=Cognaticolwellia mytili TaxID=1888913 RepID=UPI000A1721F5|nr:GNAT family N-acetyltransferase [Cognaticolwellia mytili]
MNVKSKQIDPPIIQVTVKPLLAKQIKFLKEKWLTLEAKSSSFFFLSWKWIGPWLEQVSTSNKLILVEARQNEQIIGLGIFSEQKITRHGILKSTQWFLHRSGTNHNDQIWIENNDFLTTDENQELITQAIWKSLLLKHRHVDEFIIAMYHNKLDQFTLPSTLKYKKFIIHSENGYYINLTSISTIESYLSLLSKNTRKQINRSLKLLSTLGKYEFSVIQDPTQQNKILRNSAHWHISKWQETNTPSGFINTNFTSFHQNLINEVHPTNETLVASLNINEELVGCLYCFIDDKCAYFYLSALKPFADNRIKLGLNLHALFIQWLLENKPLIEKYDFLAGEARYKKSLSNYQDDHSYIVIQKKLFKFKIERLLIRLKDRLKRLLT